MPYHMLLLGYTCGHGDAQSLQRLIESSKIPLIFDLDQTLIHAFTTKHLKEQALDRLAEDMCVPAW